jgi:flavin reductase (DIM6/NTAB) family NADH-FMN oxidoreductase RutF
MKKEISAEFMWHLDEVVIPFPVALVTTIDALDRINAAPFGLILPYCSDPSNPQMLLCTASMWQTSYNIIETEEFVINYAPYALIEKVAEAGKMFDAGVNEIERTGLTALPSIKVRPPRIEECFQHIECILEKVDRPTERQTNFIGKIVSISMNETLINKTRDEKLKIADPLLIYGDDIVKQTGNYMRTGETRTYTPPDIYDLD